MLSYQPLTYTALGAEHAWLVSDLHLSIWPKAYGSIFGQERLQHLPREESLHTWQERMQNPGYRGIGLWQEEELVGFAGWGAVTPTLAEIFHFYLKPDFWGRGVAAVFMHHLLQQIKQEHFTAVELWVLKENWRARRFYQKQEFVALPQEQLRHKWGLSLQEIRLGCNIQEVKELKN